MNEQIAVKQTREDPSYNFEVIVKENGTDTQHAVSMSKDYFNSLDTERGPWEVIHETFLFLLDKEPKEAILKEFDITLVSHYFPEFKEVLIEKLRTE